jgi:AraC-like DNA-binding protein
MFYLKTNVVKPLHYISCGQFVNTDWIHEKRCIDSFEIIYGIKGCLYMQQDDVLYEVTEGKSLLILPGHIHGGYQKSRSEVSFYWMHFTCQDSFNLTDSNSVLPGLYPGDSSGIITVPVFFTPRESERLLILIKQLLHSSTSKNTMPLVSSYFLTLIMIELSQQFSVSSVLNDPCDTTSRRLAAITDWLQIHADENYTVKQIADKFNFNNDYLCRIFKKYTGMSVIKYINEIKMGKAKQLLRETDLSIKEISYMLGFGDNKYFMKIFKMYETLTPSEYRNSYYRTHLNNR